MKFSIVIPVYNVEKYLDKCLSSVLNQTYKNYEVIIVNDGSTDNSQKIIDKYVQKNEKVKSYIKTNGGLSDARNYGLKYCTGEYLLFLDSDDFWEEDLLKKIENILKKNSDIELLKFKIKLVDDQYNLIKYENGYDKNFEISIEELVKLEYFEPACSYVYKLDFYKYNEFKFEKGRVHEDFGLVPIIASQTKHIYYLNYFGYNYVQRKGSIINNKSSIKDLQKCRDTLFFYDKNIKILNKMDDDTKKILKSFYSNSVIDRAKILSGQDYKNYLKELRKRKVWQNLLDDSLIRKIKKYIIRLNLNLYLKVFK